MMRMHQQRAWVWWGSLKQQKENKLVVVAFGNILLISSLVHIMLLSCITMRFLLYANCLLGSMARSFLLSESWVGIWAKVNRVEIRMIANHRFHQIFHHYSQIGLTLNANPLYWGKVIILMITVTSCPSVPQRCEWYIPSIYHQKISFYHILQHKNLAEFLNKTYFAVPLLWTFKQLW